MHYIGGYIMHECATQNVTEGKPEGWRHARQQPSLHSHRLFRAVTFTILRGAKQRRRDAVALQLSQPFQEGLALHAELHAQLPEVVLRRGRGGRGLEKATEVRAVDRLRDEGVGVLA